MYDISREALNGVRLGGPVEQLRELGRPASTKNRHYGYPELGLEVGVRAGRIESFIFLVGSSESLSEIGRSSRFTPAEPLFRTASGEDVVLGSRADRLLVERVLGPLAPTEGGDSSGLCATRADVYFGFEFSDGGTLTIIDVELTSQEPA